MKSPPGGTRYTIAGKVGVAKPRSPVPFDGGGGGDDGAESRSAAARAGVIVVLDRSDGKTLGIRLGDAKPNSGVPVVAVFQGTAG